MTDRNAGSLDWFGWRLTSEKFSYPPLGDPGSAMSRAHPAEEAAMKSDTKSAASGLMTGLPASNSQAVLQFLPDWMQTRQGEILRGGNVAIELAPQRLTGCRRNWRGAEFWDIEGLVRFHPRGELVHGGLMEEIRTAGVVTAHSPKRLEIAVPSDTTQIEMWFHNFAEIGGRCDAWDSRFGENLLVRCWRAESSSASGFGSISRRSDSESRIRQCPRSGGRQEKRISGAAERVPHGLGSTHFP